MLYISLSCCCRYICLLFKLQMGLLHLALKMHFLFYFSFSQKKIFLVIFFIRPKSTSPAWVILCPDSPLLSQELLQRGTLLLIPSHLQVALARGLTVPRAEEIWPCASKAQTGPDLRHPGFAEAPAHNSLGPPIREKR